MTSARIVPEPFHKERAESNRSIAILNAEAIRRAEAAADVSPRELMERAGNLAAEAVAAFCSRNETLVLCGPGNNGGDGYVCASALHARGWPVRVAALSPSSSEPARSEEARWGGPIEPIERAPPAPLLVDGLFGIGLRRPLDPRAADALSRLAAAASTLVALDIPSGADADSGAIFGSVPQADLTIAFGCLKPAHVLEPAASLCGRVVVADIGLPLGEAKVFRNAPTASSPLAVEIHKYHRGHVLVLAGPPARGGAARLAARGAARAGAGLVTILAEPAALPENAARLDAIMLEGLQDADALASVVADRQASVLIAGPALGTGDRAAALLDRALALPIPLVLDADVFTLIRGAPARLRRPHPTVLTPHEGEFHRLFGALPGSKIERGREAARQSGAIVVLKGPDTVIANPNGEVRVNHVRAPLLATAGSGDVLAGAIGGRIAAGDSPFSAACRAVQAHGRAGETAHPGLIADDLPERLATTLNLSC